MYVPHIISSIIYLYGIHLFISSLPAQRLQPRRRRRRYSNILGLSATTNSDNHYSRTECAWQNTEMADREPTPPAPLLYTEILFLFLHHDDAKSFKVFSLELLVQAVLK